MKVILYIAMSADGYIADKKGRVDWLDRYADLGHDYGYDAFYTSIDALVFGSNTYEQVLTFGAWPYQGKISYIFVDAHTKQVSDNPDVVFVQGDIPSFLKKVADTGVKRLWLMGGAVLAASFYKKGCIDEYDIFVMPCTLGQGIALSEDILRARRMELIAETQYPEGVVRKHYKKVA